MCCWQINDDDDDDLENGNARFARARCRTLFFVKIMVLPVFANRMYKNMNNFNE